MLCGLHENIAESVRVEGKRVAWQINFLRQGKKAREEEVRTEAVAELCEAYRSAIVDAWMSGCQSCTFAI